MKMKKKSNRLTAALILVVVLAATSVCGGFAVSSAAAANDYYVCFNSQRYAVRNANKMTLADGEYTLYNVTVASTDDFYVTDNAGTRFYAANDLPMKVSESGAYAYDVKFSPTKVYSDEEGGFQKTDCHITYAFHVPASYSVSIDGAVTSLSYNPYRTDLDLYFISAVHIAAGKSVIYDPNGINEEHAILSDGWYRILFTPTKTVGTDVYLFDANGNYGSGEDFQYHVYIEDAPRYYAVFETAVGGIGDPDTQIEQRDAYLLTRYENNVASREYRSSKFFIPSSDYSLKYDIYEQSPTGSFVVVDDDNDEDTLISKLKITDAGWYSLSLSDLGASFVTIAAYEATSFNGYYAVGAFNGWGFHSSGTVDPGDRYQFVKIEEGDEDYNQDYVQYILYLTVEERELSGGDIAFYITDGETKYKNGTQYISLNTAGKYKILFSDEHLYGRDRNYRYTLEDEKKGDTEIEIASAEQFFEFARKCGADADYSVNLIVYLVSDIDFAGMTFIPVKSFSGTFHGGYHTLQNITVTDSGAPSVFTMVTRQARIERLNIVNLKAGGKDCEYAGFIGKNYGCVERVNVGGNISASRYAGAIAAYNGRSAVDQNSTTADSTKIVQKGNILSCESTAAVIGEVDIGGICGFNSGDVTQSSASGSVEGVKFDSQSSILSIGGIAGYSAGKITGCTNHALVGKDNAGLYVGGIAGLATGEIYFAENDGTISGGKYVGGIVGYYGTVAQDNQDLADFFGGMDYQAFLDRYFGNSEEDFEQAEGVAHIVTYSISSGSISALGSAGGILGYTQVEQLTVKNCASSAEVHVGAGNYAGGIVGYAASGTVIRGCMSTGEIKASGLNGGQFVGGVAGYAAAIENSQSSAKLGGNDYIGGICGYNETTIHSCYSDVLITAPKNAQNIGEIAGFTAAYSVSLHQFSDTFAFNYHIGVLGGIGGRNYGAEFSFAAAKIESEKLLSIGALSPHVGSGFSHEYWQGGNGDARYPMPYYFEHADIAEEFGSDTDFIVLFDARRAMFSTFADRYTRQTFTISFLEWNKENGDLIKDGMIQTDSFEVIYTVRLSMGEQLTAPEFKYAEKKYGGFVYDGDNASYFVSFPSLSSVTESTAIYAEYREIAVSLADEAGKVLVDGIFDAQTKVELIAQGGNFTLRFTLSGEQINPGTVIVRYLVGTDAADKIVYFVDGSEVTKQPSQVSGKYITFRYESGDYFYLGERGLAALPDWAWGLIGGGIGAVAVAVVVGIIFLIKKKRGNNGKTKAE